MFKCTFKLEQHTPIIHFQPDQSGATLRASELKPKFDKFLLEKIPDLPHKINNGSKYLDYKVKITADSTFSDIDRRNPLFFGNMGDGNTKKFSIAGNISVEFLSFNTTIKDKINGYFKEFLANTNFGTRQSKGFGCFYIKDNNFETTLVKYKVYKFNSYLNSYQNDIKLFYSLLRSGINHNMYAKPLIFNYAKDNNITWEKKKIKQAYFNPQLTTQQTQYTDPTNCVNYNSEKEYIVRDLFGLSTEQDWRYYNNAKITKEHTERDKNKKIERFKSPIIFKPIKTRNEIIVYFWADNSVSEILDKKFLIQKNRIGDLELLTPKKFSFDKFFEYAFDPNKINLTTYITNHNNCNDYRRLVKIFEELSTQIGGTP
jgi:hypothetical protein